jgi:hypothetical protein
MGVIFNYIERVYYKKTIRMMFHIHIILFISAGFLFSQDMSDLEKIKYERYNYKIEPLQRYLQLTIYIKTRYLKNNDYVSMKETLPDLDSVMKEMKRIVLPGILSENDELFTDYKMILESNIKEYKDALKKNEYDKLVKITDNFYTLFIAFFIMTVPSTEKCEDFHVLIYYLEKHASIKNSKEELNSFIPLLIKRKNELLEAKFKYLGKPDQVNEGMIKYFEEQKQLLTPKVDNLINIIKSGTMEEIETTLEDVHKQYHKCDDALRPQFFK